jgi:pimeloyl-ACP methyl ester carboxylesterase
MDHTVWTLQTRWFAHHGRSALAVDLPGHGRSAGPPLGSIAAQADWLLRFLDAAALDGAALVGHSMGALICLEAATRSPQRIWALVLLGAAPELKVNPTCSRPRAAATTWRST